MLNMPTAIYRNTHTKKKIITHSNFVFVRKFKILAVVLCLHTKFSLYKIAKGIMLELFSAWPTHTLTNAAPAPYKLENHKIQVMLSHIERGH